MTGAGIGGADVAAAVDALVFVVEAAAVVKVVEGAAAVRVVAFVVVLAQWIDRFAGVHAVALFSLWHPFFLSVVGVASMKQLAGVGALALNGDAELEFVA